MGMGDVSGGWGLVGEGWMEGEGRRYHRLAVLGEGCQGMVSDPPTPR